MTKTDRKKTAPPAVAKPVADPVAPLATPRLFHWRDRRDILHLGIVLACAFALRMVFFYLNQKNNPVFFFPIMDALYHHEWAEKIVAGTARVDEAFFRGPLYPYVLALFYKISGSSIAFAVFVQHLMGTCNAGLIYLLSREYFSPRVSLVAGITCALYWTLVYFEGDLLIETLVLPLNTLGFLSLAIALRTNSAWRFGLSGLAFGLSAIARPSILIFFPVIPFAIYLNRHSRSSRPLPWVTQSAVVLGVIAAVILPVMIRNYVADRSIVPIATSGGVNFYIGNNRLSDGSTAIVPGTRADWWGGYYDAIAIAEREEGRKLKTSEVSNYFFRKGLEWINDRPGDAARHFLRKLRFFWAGPERANNKFLYFFWGLAGMRYVPLPGFWLVGPLALCGGVLLWRRRRLLSPLYLFIATYMVGVVIYFVNARFRLPVVPLLIIFAAYAAVYTVEVTRRKDFRAVRLLVMLGVAAILVNADFLAFQQTRAYSNAFSYSTLGNAYTKMGLTDKALDQYQKAWDLNESAPTPAFEYIARDVTYNMGILLWKKDMCSRAIEALRRVGGTDQYACNALEALGDCYLRKGQIENARIVFEEFRRLAPEDERAHTGMARVYAATGAPEQAESILRTIVDPSRAVYVPAYVALAEVQRTLGKIDEAIVSYTNIAKFSGFERDALIALAELYQQKGDIPSAITTLQTASNYFPPGDPTIRDWLLRLQSQR